jgi:hypothetical protein
MPRWRSNGKELSYIAPDGQFVSTEIGVKGDAGVIGATRPLFGPQPLNVNQDDVSFDGQRFLAVTPEQAAPA